VITGSKASSEAGGTSISVFASQELKLAALVQNWDPIGVYKGDYQNSDPSEYGDLVRPLITELRSGVDVTQLKILLSDVCSHRPFAGVSRRASEILRFPSQLVRDSLKSVGSRWNWHTNSHSLSQNGMANGTTGIAQGRPGKDVRGSLAILKRSTTGLDPDHLS